MEFYNVNNNAEQIIDKIRLKNDQGMFIFCHYNITCYSNESHENIDIDKYFIEYFNKYVEKIGFVDELTSKIKYHRTECQCGCRCFSGYSRRCGHIRHCAIECMCACLNPHQCHSKFSCCGKKVDYNEKIKLRKYFIKLKDDKFIYVISIKDIGYTDKTFVTIYNKSLCSSYQSQIFRILDDDILEWSNKTNMIPIISTENNMDNLNYSFSQQFYDCSDGKDNLRYMGDGKDNLRYRGYRNVDTFAKIASILLYKPSLYI